MYNVQRGNWMQNEWHNRVRLMNEWEDKWNWDMRHWQNGDKANAEQHWTRDLALNQMVPLTENRTDIWGCIF